MKVEYAFNPNEPVGVSDGLAENQNQAPEAPEAPEANETPEAPEAPEENQAPEAPEAPEANETPEENQAPEVNDEAFLAFLNKKNGTEFKSLEEYQGSFTKEVTKEVIKEPELDEGTAKYLRFQKETGGGFKEWVALNEDLDSKSELDIAIDMVRRDNEGITLSESQAIILLSDKLGIDADDFDAMSESDKLKLSVMANKHKKTLKAEQEKYNQPVVNESADGSDAQPSGEQIMVAGELIDRAEYESQRSEYLSARETAVSGIERDEFAIEIDTADGKSNVSVNYDYTDEDKQGMLSTTESIDNILPKFVTPEGELNHTEFNKGMWWAIPENREKAIKSILSQARSAGVDEVLRKERNIDFDNRNKPEQKASKANDGYGTVGASRPNDGVTVKYAMPKS